MARLFRGCGGQHHPVAFAKQALQAVPAGQNLIHFRHRFGAAAQAQRPHAERPAARGDSPPDWPQADNTDRRPVKLPLCQPFPAALPLLRQQVRQAARNHQHPRQHELGHGYFKGRAGIGDNKALPRAQQQRRGQHMIDARACRMQPAHARPLRHQRLIAFARDPAEHHLGIPRALYRSVFFFDVGQQARFRRSLLRGQNQLRMHHGGNQNDHGRHPFCG